MSPVLSLERVSYRYPGTRRDALCDVSLDVAAGEFVVLAGLSASGKSTLLRAACGLVPHFHGGTFAGRAVVGGMDTREHGPGDLAAVAGTLFQDPETQSVMTTVRARSVSSIVIVPATSAILARPFGLRASKSSTMRGRPCVMSAPATPPVWNVRMVSCVPGSPRSASRSRPR